ncbi:LrgB family protein [Bhargavaea cecembensis]|uniref:LrgB family protein n=1 Tax=Bhargavaea cecembensis TaxID=394098 RepID=UPI00058D25FE|nr:LrgB family protein [Bhargavaea cecembensis]
MKEVSLWLFGSLLTLGAYSFGQFLYGKYKKTYFQPLIVATVLIGALLLVAGIPYETYMKGANLWNWLLGPAVVSLAYPLYFNLPMVKKYFGPILLGVLGGGLFGLFSAYWLTMLLGADPDVTRSVIPKNATTPIAIELSAMVGGIPSLTIVYVMIAGIGGAVLGIPILDRLGIKHPVARGLSIGIASHGFGAAKLFEESDKEGSVATVAYILTAILLTIVCTIFFS